MQFSCWRYSGRRARNISLRLLPAVAWCVQRTSRIAARSARFSYPVYSVHSVNADDAIPGLTGAHCLGRAGRARHWPRRRTLSITLKMIVKSLGQTHQDSQMRGLPRRSAILALSCPRVGDSLAIVRLLPPISELGQSAAMTSGKNWRKTF
jgi:hypothetical protein